MRWLILVVSPLVLAAGFWAGVNLWPDLASKELLRAIAGLFTLAWAGCAFALPKLSELTALDGFIQAERSRLRENILRARQRVWRIGILSLGCVLTLVFLSVVTSESNARLIAAFAGYATGVGLVFIWLFYRWHNEIHTFIADANEMRLAMKAKDQALERFADSNSG